MRRFFTLRAVGAAIALCGATACAPEAARPGDEAVPFVGCLSDGQSGPRAAPSPGVVPRVPPNAARRLAFYASADVAVLAPRGWNCFGLYGSGGSSLVVAPGDLPELVGPIEIGGPAVLIRRSWGGTSGRQKAAEAAARYFPHRRGIIDHLRLAHLPVEEMPAGAHPADRVRTLDGETVAFTTPAGEQGQGTEWALVRSRRPVEGLVMLVAGEEDVPDTVEVKARLPAGREALAGPILAEARTRTRSGGR
jgi:hypothetical protein